MDKIQSSLKDLGLTIKESQVYTALLSCGNAAAYTLAEKTGLKAPTVYLTLQNLISKNLVYTLPRSKKKLFYAKDPRELINSFEEKVSRTKKLLPEMLALLPSDIPKIKVNYYQGKQGIIESLDYGRKHGYKTKDIVGFYATAENLPKDILDITVKYLEDMDKRGTPLRGITPEHSSTKKILNYNSTLGHDVKVIPYTDYSAKASIEAEEQFVRIVMLQEQKSIVIDNVELAKMVRQIFEMIWKK